MSRMTRDWEQIVEHYDDAPDDSSIRAIGVLAKQIMKSNLSTGIYAWTSMWDLYIVQNEVSFPYEGPRLRISPGSERNLEFRYIDTFDAKRQWSREVPREDAWDRLLSFLHQLQWFADLKRQSQLKNPPLETG